MKFKDNELSNQTSGEEDEEDEEELIKQLYDALSQYAKLIDIKTSSNQLETYGNNSHPPQISDSKKFSSISAARNMRKNARPKQSVTPKTGSLEEKLKNGSNIEAEQRNLLAIQRMLHRAACFFIACFVMLA